jgi:organic hydroperoxide reductase OsmC/OhrA
MNEGHYLYETHLYWKGRRRGLMEVAELPPIMTSAPPEFQGEPGYWTPEHLLVAALESCFMTTFVAIAERSKLPFLSYRSSAIGRLETTATNGLELAQVTVRPVIRIEHEEERDKVRKVLEKTEKNCIVSKALGIPVRVEMRIVAEESLCDASMQDVA